MNHEDLRAAYKAHREAETSYVMENERFASLIVDGFRDYIGMPASYIDSVSATKRTMRYTPLYKLDEHGDVEQVPSLYQAVTHTYDGKFNFAFGVVLDYSEGTFPKAAFISKVECTREKNSIDVEIGGRSQTVSYDGVNPPDFSAVHAIIKDNLIEFFGRRMGEAGGSQRIGFVMPV